MARALLQRQEGEGVVKRADALRVGILAEALGDLGEVLVEPLKRVEPRQNYDRRSMLISIEDICDSGSSSEGSIEIDLVTAAKVIPLLRQLMAEELAALGVEIEP
jgi:hypothetical protein